MEYTKDPRQPTLPTFIELYDIPSDPVQLVNHYNNPQGAVDPAWAGTLNDMRKLKNMFINCAGQSCRTADGGTL